MKARKRKKSFFGQYGIRGNSGLTGNKIVVIHIAGNYDSNGMVFVNWKDWWKRAKLKTAKKNGWSIIKCAMCSKPAVSLDHHYPYMIDYNRCKKHYGKEITHER